MGKQPLLLVLAIFLIVPSCAAEEKFHLKSQTDALDQLYSHKYRGKWGVDLSEFQEIDVLDDEDETDDVGHNKRVKEDDKIGKLPGQPAVKFGQYSGYVTVDAMAGRALFYYFVEADSPISKSLPLLLWLNGGPGCSSLGNGALQELGPFRVHSDGKTLFRNTYSWNKVANVLFLETPAGVGYSYSNRTSDYQNGGDRKTAKDNYKFIVKWLQRFPEYIGRDFYITGESYAGHYVPQFAHTVLSHNKRARKPHINLKGIAIGNAALDDEADNLGMYDFFASHALISPENIENIHKYCNFTPEGQHNASFECNTAVSVADVNTFYGGIDVYNIYYPVCRSPNLTRTPTKASLANFDPCSDNYVHAYLNREDVQKALHANVTKLDHEWLACSQLVGGHFWDYSAVSSLSLLKEFMDIGLRVLVYSGDVDGRVPVTSTVYALKKMNVTTQVNWYPWRLNGQVGGYTEIYKGNLTFATVRGAGHLVPSYQPDRSLALIQYFLAAKPLPKF